MNSNISRFKMPIVKLDEGIFIPPSFLQALTKNTKKLNLYIPKAEPLRLVQEGDGDAGYTWRKS